MSYTSTEQLHQWRQQQNTTKKIKEGAEYQEPNKVAM